MASTTEVTHAELTAALAGVGGGATRAHFSTFFETGARFAPYTNGTGAAITFTNFGVILRKGTATTGGASIVTEAGDQFPKFNKNPAVAFSIEDAEGMGSGTSWKCYVGLGQMGSADGLLLTQKHIGFCIQNDNGTYKVFASCANGTAQTLSADLAASIPDFYVHSLSIKMTSGSKIEYFANGTLVATLTSNLPAGIVAADICAVVKGSAGTGNTTLRIRQFEFSYDAE